MMLQKSAACNPNKTLRTSGSLKKGKGLWADSTLIIKK